MTTIRRDTVQALADKLDRNAISLRDAKEWVRTTYRIESAAQTKTQFIREMARLADGGAA